MQFENLASRVNAAFGTSRLAQCAAITGAAAMLAFAPAAHAVPTMSSAMNLVIPATTAGLYINVISGASGTAAATPGWDINPWGSAAMSFFNPSGTSLIPGGMYVVAGGTPASLALGSVVGAASTYGSGTASFTSGWTLNSTNYFGFRFIADAGTTHYGYGAMAIGATPTVRTLTEIWFESTPDTAITIGAPIPEPASIALMLLGGLGVAGVVARRRRQAAA